MKADFTKNKIEQAEKLVKQFNPNLSDNELFVLKIALTEIAKAALSDYLKGLIDLSYNLEQQINEK